MKYQLLINPNKLIIKNDQSVSRFIAKDGDNTQICLLIYSEDLNKLVKNLSLTL